MHICTVCTIDHMYVYMDMYKNRQQSTIHVQELYICQTYMYVCTYIQKVYVHTFVRTIR